MLKDSVWGILLGVVVFIAVAAVLYLILGAPACDALANQTAYQLVSTINSVAEKVPVYSGSDVPTDSGYYLTAPIRLCQEFKGIPILTQLQLQVQGAIPEYQIYYERFPEGAALWTEAYPWSGGAANNLLFFGFLKYGAKPLFKAVATKNIKYIWFGKISIPLKATVTIARAMKKANDIFKNKVRTLFFAGADEIDDVFAKNPDLNLGEMIYSMITQKHLKAGTERRLMLGLTKEGKARLNGKMTVGELFDGESGEIFVGKKYFGDVVGELTPEERAMTVEEALKPHINAMTNEEAGTFSRTYTFTDDIDQATGTMEKIRNTKFYQEYFKSVADKIDEAVKEIKALGYKVELTKIFTPTKSRKFAREFLALCGDEPETCDKIAKGLLSRKDKLSIKFKELFVEDAGKYKMSNKLANVLNDLIDESKSSKFMFVGEDSKLLKVLEDPSWTRQYLRGLPDEPKELAAFIGFLEQNPKAFKAEWLEAGIKYEAKKIIVLDGLGFAHPSGFGPKGLISAMMTEGCLGNSICVYSHAAQMESPSYLSEKAQEYFVRAYRPLTVAENFAGIQGLLMQIPSNPRFYAVGPCFGIAKIWKVNNATTNEKTIFVAINKCDTGTSNYCYADKDLIDKYSALWLGSDILTFIPVVGEFAPIIQAGGEIYLNWPGAPFAELTYDAMNKAAGACVWKPAEEALKAIEKSK